MLKPPKLNNDIVPNSKIWYIEGKNFQRSDNNLMLNSKLVKTMKLPC